MTAPVSEEGFHEIQLSGKQLVFLFMATTVVSVVIFLLGVVVGRRVPAETLAAETTGVPVAGLPLDSAQPAPGAIPPAAEPPPPVQEDPDQFSYHQRLQQAQPPAESVKPPPSAPPAAPAVEDPPAAAGGGEWVAQIGAYSTRAAAESVVERLKRNDFPAFILAPTPGTPGATFRVRVGPYRERREAEAIAGRLERELQFKAFVTR